MNEITIGNKVYISAKRAAEITGYARDYVGQLCREGHVDAKMVGRSWYVYEPAIRAHRFGPEAVTEPQKPAASTGQGSAVIQKPAEEEASAWEKPKYTAEEPELLPALEELLPPAEETLTDMQAAWREWFEQRQTELETPEIESPEVIDARNEAYEAEHEAQEAVPEVASIEEETIIPVHHLAEEDPKAAEEPIAAQMGSGEEIRIPIHSFVPPAPVRPHLDIAPPQPAIHQPASPITSRYTAEPKAPPIEQGKILSERIVRPQERQNTRAATRSRGSSAPLAAALIGISLICIAVAAIGTGYAGRYLKTLPTRDNPAIKYLVGTQEFTRQ